MEHRLVGVAPSRKSRGEFAPLSASTGLTLATKSSDLSLEGGIVTSEFHFYLGVDSATRRHQACIMDAQGQVLGQRKIEHSGTGILDFIRWMEELEKGQVRGIAVAIEVPRDASQLKLSRVAVQLRWAPSAGLLKSCLRRVDP